MAFLTVFIAACPFSSLMTFVEGIRNSSQEKRGLPAATIAMAVAITVITQFSLRVAFISYLDFLIVSSWCQYPKWLSPVSRQKLKVPGETRGARLLGWKI
jgi:hypothetical protein